MRVIAIIDNLTILELLLINIFLKRIKKLLKVTVYDE